MATRSEAALLRRDEFASLADRPSQRRSSENPASSARAAARLASMELRASTDGALLRFDGVASATEHGYDMFDVFGPYTEIVSQGAFKETLSTPGLDVPLVLGHDQLRRLARTTNGSLHLSEVDDGLHVLADLDPTDPDVAYITPKLRSGLIDEMSFAFRIDSGTWSPDYTEYRITAVNIQRGDVAIVGFGANPHTSADLRKSPEELARAASDDEIEHMRAVLRGEFERRHPAPTMTRAQLAALVARGIHA